jgi:hypothetical protein
VEEVFEEVGYARGVNEDESGRARVWRALRALYELFSLLVVMSVIGLVFAWLAVAFLRLLLGF